MTDEQRVVANKLAKLFDDDAKATLYCYHKIMERKEV